ncbi:hypothetical protein D9758_009217 [Tetrapyrgos nigripes]|uniref:Uracil-DNA glycosylase-like domain-containing protein n=1 Tax=Tetrapyrgos nigripes TaxID=182062 RepID=A0A8H5D3W0_9AGAR|nr:hypothetical protein D9758_009217 [Tetrapyrgos nigripes]
MVSRSSTKNVEGRDSLAESSKTPAPAKSRGRTAATRTTSTTVSTRTRSTQQLPPASAPTSSPTKRPTAAQVTSLSDDFKRTVRVYVEVPIVDKTGSVPVASAYDVDDSSTVRRSPRKHGQIDMDTEQETLNTAGVSIRRSPRKRGQIEEMGDKDLASSESLSPTSKRSRRHRELGQKDIGLQGLKQEEEAANLKPLLVDTKLSRSQFGSAATLVDEEEEEEELSFLRTPTPRRSPRKRTQDDIDHDSSASQRQQNRDLPSESPSPSKRSRRLLKVEETEEILSMPHVSSSSSIQVELKATSSRSTRSLRSGSRSRSPTKARLGTASLTKRRATYAPPEQFAHLNPIDDRMVEDLDVVFCGINPGKTSGGNGYHYSGPNNRFWPALSLSNFSSGQQLSYTDGPNLPRLLDLGLTDLVSRPTASGKQLSLQEQRDVVKPFLRKVSEYRPRIVCFMGLGSPAGIVRSVVRTDLARSEKMVVGNMNMKLVHDWVTDPNTVHETIFWALPSPSGANGAYQKNDMVGFLNEVHSYLNDLKQSTINTNDMFTIEIPFESSDSPAV